MIVSASRRTDIPAFHTEWFLNRLREGYCVVNHHTASGLYHRVPLTPYVVDCIVFRSRIPLRCSCGWMSCATTTTYSTSQ